MRTRLTSFMTMAILLAFATAAIALPEEKKGLSQAELQKKAKITMKQARAIALTRVPGTVKSAELENEGGLVYSFDIKTKKSGIEEVLVSAIDGRIVKVEHETPAKEAAEKKQEAKEKAAAAKKP